MRTFLGVLLGEAIEGKSISFSRFALLE
jgi:hypothetical protein